MKTSKTYAVRLNLIHHISQGGKQQQQQENKQTKKPIDNIFPLRKLRFRIRTCDLF